MKKMKVAVCSCSICERVKDSNRHYNKYQVGWRHQAIDKRKKELIESKRAEIFSDELIKQFMGKNIN